MASGLNPQQREAVTTTEGPLLVLAGAGTGKTRVVTERIAYLLREKHVAPERVIAVTFTNKAAGEMKERLAALLGQKRCPPELIVSTFHSLCVRILRRDAERLGYRRGWTICDTGGQISIVRRALRHLAGARRMKPEEILQRISRLKCDGLSPRRYLTGAVEEDEETVGHVWRKYQEHLRATNTMDFDDLLVNAVAVLRQEEDARAHWQERAAHLIVDEFQDTSDIQFELLKLLAEPQRNLCVVGDDDQSIYAWRGARPRNIVHFEGHFPGARTVRLEENYRSINTVLQAANALIAQNEERVGKTLWSRLGDGEPLAVIEATDAEEEAERVVKRLHRSVQAGAPARDHAILVRTNQQTRLFEEELRAYRLPYVVIGGQSFYDRKEVRDVLAYLTVLANPHDDAALLRVINTPSRGLGSKSIAALAEAAAGRGLPLCRCLEQAGTVTGLSPAARRGAAELAGALSALQARVRSGRLEGLVAELLSAVAYHEEVESLYDDPLAAAAHLDAAREVDDSLRAYLNREAQPELAGFLQEASVTREEAESEEDRRQAARSVRIITLHSAKGLEFPHVYLAGLQEGLLPHQNSTEHEQIAEERRLAYVGITRARRSLTLSYATHRSQRGKRVPIKPSRFLEEIPPALLDRSDRERSREEVQARMAAIRASLE